MTIDRDSPLAVALHKAIIAHPSYDLSRFQRAIAIERLGILLTDDEESEKRDALARIALQAV